MWDFNLYDHNESILITCATLFSSKKHTHTTPSDGYLAEINHLNVFTCGMSRKKISITGP